MPSAAFLTAAAAANRQPVVLMAIESADAIRRELTTQAEWEASATLTDVSTVASPGDVVLATDTGDIVLGDHEQAFVAVNSLSAYLGDTASSAATGVQTVGAKFLFRMYYAELFSTETIVIPSFRIDTLVDYWNMEITVYGRKDGGSWQDVTGAVPIECKAVPYHIGSLLTGFTHNVNVPANIPFTFGQITGTYLKTDSAVYMDVEMSVPLARGAWEFYLHVDKSTKRGRYLINSNPGFPDFGKVRYTGCYALYRSMYLSSGLVLTSTLDFGANAPFAQPSHFYADDVVPAGSSLIYSIEGSANSSSWTSLGTVVDGGAVTSYRYYRITIQFGSTQWNVTPKLSGLRMTGGDSSFIFFSTHRNEPFKGCLPYISPDGVSSLTNKLDLQKLGSTGEVSPKLVWNKYTSDLISTGKLKNKTISVKIGFVGLGESEYEPYFTGTIYDWSGDSIKRTFSLKTRDVFGRFRRKIPEETVDGSGNKTTTPLTFTGANIMQAMLDVLDASEIPDRQIDRTAFTDLRDGALASADWDVTRTISTPTDPADLLAELAVTAGVFLVPMPDGRLTPVLYDATAAAAATLKSSVCDFQRLDGGLKDLATRTLVFYSLIAGKEGNGRQDYDKALIIINVDAETEWGEIVETEWLDKWNATANAMTALGNRFDGWYSYPKMQIKATGVPPKYMGLNCGDFVALDGVPLPAPSSTWNSGTTYGYQTTEVYQGRVYRSLQAANTNHTPVSSPTWWRDEGIVVSDGLGYSDQKKFMILAKTMDPMKTGALSFELMEI